MANTWQGAFPHENLKLDGYERTTGLLHPDQICGAAPRTRATTPASPKSRFPRKVLKGGSHLCAELLPPLPPGCASPGAGGHVDEPCQFPLRRSSGEIVAMTDAPSKGSDHI